MEIKRKSTVKLLILLNLILASLLLVVCLHYSIPTKILKKIGIRSASAWKSEYKYNEDKYYNRSRHLFAVYKPKEINLVMLGDSITNAVDWNELLSRTDVANRGIGGDSTEGIINRLDDIYALNPKVCFIMAGINEVIHGIQYEGIVANYKRIINDLTAHNITTVIQSTLYVSPKRRNHRLINLRVKKLNDMLRTYAEQNQIVFIDVNRALSDDFALKEEYTYDGTHLLAHGYAKWRDLILPVIERLHKMNANKGCT